MTTDSFVYFKNHLTHHKFHSFNKSYQLQKKSNGKLLVASSPAVFLTGNSCQTWQLKKSLLKIFRFFTINLKKAPNIKRVRWVAARIFFLPHFTLMHCPSWRWANIKGCVMNTQMGALMNRTLKTASSCALLMQIFLLEDVFGVFSFEMFSKKNSSSSLSFLLFRECHPMWNRLSAPKNDIWKKKFVPKFY